MKAIVGVDAAGFAEPAVRLLARMEFPDLKATLLNVADLVMPYTSFGVAPTMEPTNQIVEGLRHAGLEAVEDAQQIARTFGLEADTEVLSGPSTIMLLDRAEAVKADLIAVASTRKGFLATTFTGSMSRSIVSSSRIPVLVAKEGVLESGPVVATLATDHSEYAGRAIDQFLTMAPRGISHIHVVTAYGVSDKEAELLHANIPALGGRVHEYIEEQLQERSQALVGRLAQHGYKADFVVKEGSPNKVIAEQMRQNQSELLILGAQGHGFIERMFVGSVSFHQLVAEPYSVFILRDRKSV